MTLVELGKVLEESGAWIGGAQRKARRNVFGWEVTIIWSIQTPRLELYRTTSLTVWTKTFERSIETALARFAAKRLKDSKVP
jgi:hypothetical protein